MKTLTLVFLLAINLPSLAAQVKPASGKIADLNFLVGSFRAEGFPGEVHFTPPTLSGKILGVGRIVSADPKQDFAEFSRIEEQNGTLVLTPFPEGVQGLSFTATTIIPGRRVVFENPDNPYVSRITYELQADGSLLTHVQGGGIGDQQYSEKRTN